MVDIDLSDKSLIYKVGVSIALLRYQLGRLILVFQPPLNVDSTTYVVSIKLRSTRMLVLKTMAEVFRYHPSSLVQCGICLDLTRSSAVYLSFATTFRAENPEKCGPLYTCIQI